MKSHFSLLFLAVLLLTACKNNPNELIVGKWTCVDVQADFPALEELNPDSLTEQEQPDNGYFRFAVERPQRIYPSFY